LTEDFFAFADFYQNQTEAPSNPGIGYEVTRFYLGGSREYAFDRLHYYPDTGFVYYDGIVGGSSEYDGEWYPARPEIKAIFEDTVLIKFSLDSPPFTSTDQAGVNSRSARPPTVLVFTWEAVFGVIILLALMSAGIWYFRVRSAKGRYPERSLEIPTQGG
jgi:hypothetical protein